MGDLAVASPAWLRIDDYENAESFQRVHEITKHWKDELWHKVQKSKERRESLEQEWNKISIQPKGLKEFLAQSEDLHILDELNLLKANKALFKKRLKYAEEFFETYAPKWEQWFKTHKGELATRLWHFLIARYAKATEFMDEMPGCRIITWRRFLSKEITQNLWNSQELDEWFKDFDEKKRQEYLKSKEGGSKNE
jgi:hypothetical protein